MGHQTLVFYGLTVFNLILNFSEDIILMFSTPLTFPNISISVIKYNFFIVKFRYRISRGVWTGGVWVG